MRQRNGERMKNNKPLTPKQRERLAREARQKNAAKRLCKENPEKQFLNRLGLSVTKKIGGAVQRNPAKRMIRAAYDDLKGDLKRGFLIVISAREAINGKKSTDVREELGEAFSRLGMLTGATHAKKTTL